MRSLFRKGKNLVLKVTTIADKIEFGDFKKTGLELLKLSATSQVIYFYKGGSFPD